MARNFYSAIVLFVMLSLLTGGLYPFVVTLVAQGFFAHQANGSLVRENGIIVGSELIGQQFSSEKYFWGRPSAAAYNGSASSGSNLGPINPALVDNVREAADKFGATSEKLVPVDLVTSSGSGLDPDITPAAARYQIPRVAKARGMSEEKVRQLVDSNTMDRTLGILGERRVNVLELNRALDAVASVK